jgi:exonuclease VII small subunit
MFTQSTDELSDTVRHLHEASSSAIQRRSTTAFFEFERQLSELDAYVRELQQAMWYEPARVAIRHLTSGDPLTDGDLEVIRTLLVSDAERYLQRENNFEDWLRELDRLLNDIEQRVRTLDRVSIADLRGVIKDAVRVVPSIRNFLDERQRVERFDVAVKSLDEKSRKLLADVLREHMEDGRR